MNGDYGMNEHDGTRDTYPRWPQDWDIPENGLDASFRFK